MKLTAVRLGVPLGAGLLMLGGCADPAAEPDDPGPAAEPGAGDQQRYEVAATVLESPEHGPQLCSGVEDSLPPQCGGPDIVGWDWETVEAESVGGTTWGEYVLVGTWDGERFTLTEPAVGADGNRTPDPDEGDPFATPCPAPDGGWQPIDPATTTEGAMEEALARAATAPDYAGGWLDQSYLDGVEDSELEEHANDPVRLVLNLRFTGELAAREQWIREVWGGALCVTGADHPLAELRDIQQRLHEDLPDVQSSGVDEVANVVTAQVLVATPELQQRLDDEYGEGTVRLDGWLRPVKE